MYDCETVRVRSCRDDDVCSFIPIVAGCAMTCSDLELRFLTHGNISEFVFCLASVEVYSVNRTSLVIDKHSATLLILSRSCDLGAEYCRRLHLVLR